MNKSRKMDHQDQVKTTLKQKQKKTKTKQKIEGKQYTAGLVKRFTDYLPWLNTSQPPPPPQHTRLLQITFSSETVVYAHCLVTMPSKTYTILSA